MFLYDFWLNVVVFCCPLGLINICYLFFDCVGEYGISRLSWEFFTFGVSLCVFFWVFPFSFRYYVLRVLLPFNLAPSTRLFIRFFYCITFSTTTYALTVGRCFGFNRRLFLHLGKHAMNFKLTQGGFCVASILIRNQEMEQIWYMSVKIAFFLM